MNVFELDNELEMYRSRKLHDAKRLFSSGRPHTSCSSATRSPARSRSPPSSRCKATQASLSRGAPKRRVGKPGSTTLMPSIFSDLPASMPAQRNTLRVPAAAAATIERSGT
jgi:hypothetical protein